MKKFSHNTGSDMGNKFSVLSRTSFVNNMLKYSRKKKAAGIKDYEVPRSAEFFQPSPLSDEKKAFRQDQENCLVSAGLDFTLLRTRLLALFSKLRPSDYQEDDRPGEALTDEINRINIADPIDLVQLAIDLEYGYLFELSGLDMTQESAKQVVDYYQAKYDRADVFGLR